MGGGKHKKQNPHGSPTGKKLRGDKLAQKVHGRKGMHKDRREKGQSHQSISVGREQREIDLNDDEFQIIWLLFVRHVYNHPGMEWEQLTMELDMINIPHEEADPFLQELRSKVSPWLKYTPYFSAYLDKDFVGEISEFTSTYLDRKKETK